MMIDPDIHNATGEFVAIVPGTRVKHSALPHHRLDYLLATERLIGDETQTLSHELIDYR